MKALRNLVLGCLLFASSHVAALEQPGRKILFAAGKAAVVIPSSYLDSFDTEGTLQLIEVPNHSVRFYLSHHDLGAMEGRDVVRLLAKRKGLNVEELGGHFVAVEEGPQTIVEGKAVANTHRLIGFEHSLVVLSTAIEADKLSTPPTRLFLDQHLPVIVRSLHQVPPQN